MVVEDLALLKEQVRATGRFVSIQPVLGFGVVRGSGWPGFLFWDGFLLVGGNGKADVLYFGELKNSGLNDVLFKIYPNHGLILEMFPAGFFKNGSRKS